MTGRSQRRLIIAIAAGLAALILSGGLVLVRSIQAGDDERLSFTLYRVSAELAQTLGDYPADTALRGFLILGGRGEILARGGRYQADPLIERVNGYWNSEGLLVYHRQLSGVNTGSNPVGAGHSQGRQIVVWYDPAEFRRDQRFRDTILLSALGLLTLLTLSAGLLTAWLLKAYQNLAKQERLALLGQATRTISHELQTPLTALDLHRQLAAKKLESTTGEADRGGLLSHLEAIRLETMRIKHVMRDIRRLVRPEQGNFEILSLSDFINDFSKELVLPEGQTIAVVNEWPGYNTTDAAGPGRADLVKADRAQLAAIIRNLALNAAQSQQSAAATQPIILRLAKQGRFVILEVLDQGCGLTTASRRQAFEAFFTTKPEGSGLGLPLSRSLAKAMGGELNLAGRRPQGCIARLRLPISQKQTGR